MLNCQVFNVFGIVLQVGAAAYIVLQAWRTAVALRGMKVTIDSLDDIIPQLGREMAGQFWHQFIAFIVLALGAGLQLVCPILELIR